MADLPLPVTQYIYRRSVKDRYPAFFSLDKNANVVSWGGMVDHYGLSAPQKGMPVTDILICTEGLFPLAEDSLELDCVEISSETVVDVVVFKDNSGYWLVLFDARKKRARQQVLQQKANELTLLRDVHNKILDQYLGREIAEKLLKIDSNKGGERRVLSILFADIRGFTTFCEYRSPSVIFRILNAYLKAMIRPVLEGGGIVDKIIGDAVMAVFGILPSALAPATLAVTAARKMLKEVGPVFKKPVHGKDQGLNIGIGIATGPVVMGIMGSRDRRTLSVTGHTVNIASRLESMARPGELLVDAQTARDMDAESMEFLPRTLALKGLNCHETAYSWKGIL